MKLSAVLAVTPAIAIEIQDETILETLSSELQNTIRGDVGKGNRPITIAEEQNTVIDVRGTKVALDEAQERWPIGITILGVWNRNGTQVGTEYVMDETDPENPVRVRQGEPTYPLQLTHLVDSMPDWVTRDENGIETGRGRPTAYAPPLVLLGEVPREVS